MAELARLDEQRGVEVALGLLKSSLLQFGAAVVVRVEAYTWQHGVVSREARVPRGSTGWGAGWFVQKRIVRLHLRACSAPPPSRAAG